MVEVIEPIIEPCTVHSAVYSALYNRCQCAIGASVCSVQRTGEWIMEKEREEREGRLF